VNREFRLSCADERHEYLRRLSRALETSDWKLLSYALMSSHIHKGYIAGRERFEDLTKRAHSPFALWLNKRQRRLGHVFAPFSSLGVEQAIH